MNWDSVVGLYTAVTGSDVEMEPRGTALELGIGLDTGWAVVPSEGVGGVEPDRSFSEESVVDISEPSGLEPGVDSAPSSDAVVSEPAVLLASDDGVVDSEATCDPSVLESGAAVIGSPG